jgi:hypothetical protein
MGNISSILSAKIRQKSTTPKALEVEVEVERLDKPTVRDDAASVYSYTSTRDVSQFVKELHGR